MSETKKKRTNKTKEELVSRMVDAKLSEVNTHKKELIKTRMEALANLEKELGCVFVPLINRTNTGSQTYIAPFDAPKEEVEEVTSSDKTTTEVKTD